MDNSKRYIWAFLIAFAILPFVWIAFADDPNDMGFVGGISVICIFIIWIWMLTDLFRRKDLRRRVLWGWCLILFNWLAAMAYFIFVYYPAELKMTKSEEGAGPPKQDDRRIKTTKVLLIALGITVFHAGFMKVFYRTFGVPDILAFIYNNITYYPYIKFLSFVYDLFSVDLSHGASGGVMLFLTISKFIYTYLLFVIAVMLFLKAHRYFRLKGKTKMA